MSILKPQGIQTWLNVSGLSWVYTILQISINQSINRSINQSVRSHFFYLRHSTTTQSTRHKLPFSRYRFDWNISFFVVILFLCYCYGIQTQLRILFGSNQYRIIQVADALQLEYLFETYIEKGPFASIGSDQCWDFIGQNIVPLSECHGLPARIIWH